MKKLAFAVLSAVAASSPGTTWAAEGHELKHHALGIFIGNADERGGEDDYTLGIEYEYRFNQKWGAGFVAEHTPDGHGSDGISTAFANAYYHPYKGWRLGLGGGREKVHGDDGYYAWIYRAGIAYDFHIGDFGIAPSVNYDAIESHNSVLVYGVALVYMF